MIPTALLRFLNRYGVACVGKESEPSGLSVGHFMHLLYFCVTLGGR